MNIFAEHAPKYWAKGLPAIPLKVGQKRPAVGAWANFCVAMPPESEMDAWMRAFPDANIGLALGPQSGIVMIDVDSDDPRVMRAIEQVLPPSPWKRIGSKGCALAYRFQDQTTCQILLETGKPLVEILGKGRQLVLPPSIHPDTGKPYVSNVDLLQVLAILPVAPRNVEALIRGALEDQGFNLSVGGSTGKVSVFVPSGMRDNQMVAHAGILSRGICRGERTLVEALFEMKHWVETFTEKVAGDEMSVEKAQKKVLEFLLRDVKGPRRLTLPVGWDQGLTDKEKEELGLDFSDDNEDWDYETTFTYLVEQLSRFQDDHAPGRMAVLEKALDHIARSTSMNNLDQERIYKYLANQYKDLSAAAIRKRVNELARGELKGEDHTEIAKAVIEDFNENGELKFHGGQFWQWNGACWRVIDDQSIRAYIANEYGKYPSARKGGEHSAILKVMQALCASDIVEVSRIGINFANGFLTDDGDLLDHSPEFGMTYVMPFRYRPELAAACPMFMTMLEQYWGRDPDYADKVAALQEAMGATIFGQATKYQRAFLLLGVPAAGKSRIVQIISAMMPPEAKCAVSPTQWHDKFMPAQLQGRLFNMAGELSERTKIKGDTFKMIVCGEPIEAQFKNKPVFTLEPRAAHWFASNHTPKTLDTSAAFNRRWLILHFAHPIDATRRVADIDRIVVAQEAEAVAAWAVEGFMRLKQKGDFTLPASHETIIQEIANENNSVRYFLACSPRIRVGRLAHQGKSGGLITAAQLHNEYFNFCLVGKVAQRVHLIQFNQMMGELCHELDFEQKTVPTTQNQSQIVYEWITLADAKAA